MTTGISVPQAAKVTLITVSYNSTAVLPAMLASRPAATPAVVVDNASRDVPALQTLCDAQGAKLIRNPVNTGFGSACNLGAAAADTEFLLFLNPDATLAPGCIDALVAAMDRYPDACAMNPRIADPKGGADFKRGSVLLPRSSWLPRGWPPSDREVPVLSGAALFVRRAAFEAVHGFDPAIFLYHEDDDLSLRLKTQGALMFIRNALVSHQGGASTVRSPEVAALKAWHMGRSRVYAMRRHDRPLPFTGALAGALLQLASPLVVLSRRKRAKQVAFLKGVLSAALETPPKPLGAR